MEENKLIDLDFTGNNGRYYVLFRNPKNKIIRVEDIDKIMLKRNSEDSVVLKIHTHDNKSIIYHYPNDLINLLDDLELGLL